MKRILLFLMLAGCAKKETWKLCDGSTFTVREDEMPGEVARDAPSSFTLRDGVWTQARCGTKDEELPVEVNGRVPPNYVLIMRRGELVWVPRKQIPGLSE